MAEQDRHNFRKLSPLGPRQTEVPPVPPPVDPAEAADVAPDHSDPDHAAKVLSASLRLLGSAGLGMMATPAAAEVVQSQTQTVDTSLHLTLSEMVELQTTADMFLQPARAEALSQNLGSEQSAEQTSLLHRAYQELRSETGEIAKDLLKGYVKGAIKHGAAAVLISIAAWFKRTGKEKKVKQIEWLGGAIAKLASLLEKQHSVTAQEVATECGCTPVQAVALLQYLGFQEREGAWVAPKPAA
jgi:hypothetical protein